jgi:DNA-binding NtrC family response regulator
VEDILPLAQHFLDKYRRPLGKEIRGFSDGARRHLLTHPWPGNVRELEASIQRAVTLTKNAVLEPEDFPLERVVASSDHPGGPHGPLTDVIREAERRYLTEILRSVGGRRQRAAEVLGLSRKTLWKKLKLLGPE